MRFTRAAATVVALACALGVAAPADAEQGGAGQGGTQQGVTEQGGAHAPSQRT
ncbi:hypothetical protein ACIGB8_23020 [Promicromonospora sukumoe]|uniref:hypothetical protein n=1 Tax=Promicromonospora sukumoe TaxID=88382 RepID=UPI0037C52071